MQHCAHNTQAQALHRHIGGSRTRASPANAPVERHMHVHSDVQQHARASPPPLICHCLPSSSTTSKWFFSGICTSSTPAIAAD
eukprot:4829547-Prymnesium_polylepis.1